MASEPFISQVSIFAFNFAPRGWAQCNGQLLPINQNQALFSLLGTTYGGNGTTNFALPNLQGRVPIHNGNGFTLGQQGGVENHTLTAQEMPGHTHTVSAVNSTADQTYPTSNTWAAGGSAAGFYTGGNNAMAAGAITSTGGRQPHSNRSPYAVLNICIALQGIFPSRN